MASNDDLITGLMIKYARHEKLTDEEMRILEEWWQQSPEHRRLADQFGDEEWVKAELARMKPAPMKEMWEGINKYLDEIGAPDDRDTPMEWENPAGEPALPRRRWIGPLTIAASVALCVCAVWLMVGKTGTKGNGGTQTAVVIRESKSIAKEDGVLLVGNDGSTVDMNADVWNAPAPQDGNPGWQAVLVGKHRGPFCVRLASGSNVWLDGGSRIENNVAHGAETVSYTVEGKAYFDVVRNASHPFLVRTVHGDTIEDLGTTFHVESYATDSESRVVLLTGKVRVRSGADSKILQPAQEAILSPGKMDVRPMRDPGVTTAWVKESLYFHFDNTEFTTAVAAVASWYGYTVSNPKNLRGIPITDVLRKDPSPEDVVSNIGQIETGYLYVWVKDNVIFISDSPPTKV